MAVGVSVAVAVGDELGVRVAVGDWPGVAVDVAVGVGVELASLGVSEGLGVTVTLAVAVGVHVLVLVAVMVIVGVGVWLGPKVGEGLGVSVGVAVGGATSNHCAWPVVFGFVAGYSTVRSVAGGNTRRWAVGFVPLLPHASGRQKEISSSEMKTPGVVGLGHRVSTTLPNSPLLEARA